MKKNKKTPKKTPFFLLLKSKNRLSYLRVFISFIKKPFLIYINHVVVVVVVVILSLFALCCLP